MRFLPAFLISIGLFLTPTVNTLHIKHIRTQHILQQQQDMNVGVFPTVLETYPIHQKIDIKDIEHKYCLIDDRDPKKENKDDTPNEIARKHFLDGDFTFKCKARGEQELSFKKIHENFADSLAITVASRKKPVTHWGVLVMEWIQPNGQIEHVICAAANADHDENDQEKQEPYSVINYGSAGQGGQHSERICLEYYTDYLFGKWKALGLSAQGWNPVPNNNLFGEIQAAKIKKESKKVKTKDKSTSSSGGKKPKDKTSTSSGSGGKKKTKKQEETKETEDTKQGTDKIDKLVAKFPQGDANTHGRLKIGYCTTKIACEFCEEAFIIFTKGMTRAGYTVTTILNACK